MNKRVFLLLPISLALFACGVDKGPAVLKCETSTGPNPPCEGRPNNEVNINTTTWVVTPRCINARTKETIVFNLAPAADNPLGSTAIRPKEPQDTWLTGVNSPISGKIEIAVPDWVPLDVYMYGVFKSNGDCLDPRVRIVP